VLQSQSDGGMENREEMSVKDSHSCVDVCCSALQCVAVCFRVLHRVEACCSVLQRVAACCSVLQRVAARVAVAQRQRNEKTSAVGNGFSLLCYSVLKSVVVCLQYVAVCVQSVAVCLQSVAVCLQSRSDRGSNRKVPLVRASHSCVAVCCRVLQCSVVRCRAL